MSRVYRYIGISLDFYTYICARAPGLFVLCIFSDWSGREREISPLMGETSARSFSLECAARMLYIPTYSGAESYYFCVATRFLACTSVSVAFFC